MSYRKNSLSGIIPPEVNPDQFRGIDQAFNDLEMGARKTPINDGHPNEKLDMFNEKVMDEIINTLVTWVTRMDNTTQFIIMRETIKLVGRNRIEEIARAKEHQLELEKALEEVCQKIALLHKEHQQLLEMYNDMSNG